MATKMMSNYLNETYEEKIRPCIDLIDSLRALGVEKDLALPAIAVIGDQSSGKSSVLEALSGVSLPRGSGIVTRCPLELKLCKGKTDSEWSGKISYLTINQELQSPSEVEKEIMKAQDAMAGSGNGISSDSISLEVRSPDVPDLTLIDLPGIARVAVGGQPKDIGDKIKRLIKQYIQKQETICLVVVPCNVDIATTEALEMAREIDPNGERTLGILTKPDLIDKCTEENIVNIVNNNVIHLKKGYMIVKCRGQQEIQERLSLKEATEREKAFFEDHEYFSELLDGEKATIPLLAQRLTAELVEHINKSLPTLEDQIKNKLQLTRDELATCGTGVPEDESEQLAFLVEKIQLFNQCIARATQGEEFITSAKNPKLFSKVREHFNSWQNKLDDSIEEFNSDLNEEVAEFETLHRGRELPGFVNYKTFEAIVKDKIDKMEEPARETLQNVTDVVGKMFTELGVQHFENFQNLYRVCKTSIENLRQSQEAIADTLIKTQFMMEAMVYAQDKCYRKELLAIQDNEDGVQTRQYAIPQPIDLLQCSVKEMTLHLKAYFKSAADRLSNQIPLIIQFHILQEYGKKMQKDMLKILQDREEHSTLLKENRDLTSTRNFLKQRISRLSEAHKRLIGFPG
ncbi:interferon-induced GTP-binding Mx1-like isoform X1 [Pelobates cultripes]|uniref:Interferon-induced GTP-binding Mx1-like isoform X1 n=1 Tax=Pelobates cultripes TaxID=61616 RepID=A0AAD1QXZ5_PELCU|nr:interferon-induced GTP-binding Mx1-like isoform X1 [Pelobates cultripes]